jgi:uncharacterized protein (UPF0303 family)
MTSENLPSANAVAAETDMLIFPAFDEGDAWALGRALVQMAQEDGLGVVINIRTPDRTLFHAALQGSAPLNDKWAWRKSNVALMYGKSSLEVGCAHREKGQDLLGNGLSNAEYADHGGAVPVVVAGVGVVAVVTVSGLPQLEDHAMVIAAMRAHLS